MPGILTKSPAHVIARLLVDNGFGGELGEAWPVYANSEPAIPDNVITVYDTTGFDQGREMVRGERAEHAGFMVRVRATTHPVGWAKVNAIAIAFDDEFYLESVNVDGEVYEVWAITRAPVISLGKLPDSNKKAFTVNGKATLRKVS